MPSSTVMLSCHISGKIHVKTLTRNALFTEQEVLLSQVKIIFEHKTAPGAIGHAMRKLQWIWMRLDHGKEDRL